MQLRLKVGRQPRLAEGVAAKGDRALLAGADGMLHVAQQDKCLCAGLPGGRCCDEIH